MDEILNRFLPEMIGRIDGPMSLLLQPCVATVFVFLDGRKDAREGKTTYGWALTWTDDERGSLLRDGWKGIARVFTIATLMDLIYQHIAINGFRPKQAFATACLLALIPYFVLRGPFNRLTHETSNSRKSRSND